MGEVLYLKTVLRNELVCIICIFWTFSVVARASIADWSFRDVGETLYDYEIHSVAKGSLQPTPNFPNLPCHKWVSFFLRKWSRCILVSISWIMDIKVFDFFLSARSLPIIFSCAVQIWVKPWSSLQYFSIVNRNNATVRYSWGLRWWRSLKVTSQRSPGPLLGWTPASSERKCQTPSIKAKIS